MEDDSLFLEKKNVPSALSILDGFLEAVESFTGFKNQFVQAGWKEEHAEQMVIEILRMGSKSSDKKEG